MYKTKYKQKIYNGFEDLQNYLYMNVYENNTHIYTTTSLNIHCKLNIFGNKGCKSIDSINNINCIYIYDTARNTTCRSVVLVPLIPCEVYRWIERFSFSREIKSVVAMDEDVEVLKVRSADDEASFKRFSSFNNLHRLYNNTIWTWGK